MISAHTFAAVDMGSNTIKVSVWRIASDRTHHTLARERFPVRLARGLHIGGQVSAPTIEAALSAFGSIRALGESHRVSTFRAVGTSAMREARNARALIEEVQRETRIAVEIITAEREGELTAKGALLGMDTPEAAMVVDIGGGSAEVIIRHADEGFRTHSLPLGAVRLTETFFPEDPPGPEAVQRLHDHVDSLIAASGLTEWEGSVIGCGGTLVSVGHMITAGQIDQSRVDTAEISHLPRERLRQLLTEMRPMCAAERERRYGIERQRAEIIVAGAVTLEAILERIGAQEIHITPRGLREGLLAEHLASLPR